MVTFTGRADPAALCVAARAECAVAPSATAAPVPAAAARTDRRPTGEELDVELGLEELTAEERDLRMRNSPCRNK